jgi:hypothetical protein
MAIRRQAKSLRESGEQVMLLIPVEAVDSYATPDDIVASNNSLDLSSVTRYPIYASLKWHDLGDFKYEAGGRAVFRKADVETTSEYRTFLAKCVGVELEGGYIMRKSSENLSQTNAVFTLTVEGYVNIT